MHGSSTNTACRFIQRNVLYDCAVYNPYISLFIQIAFHTMSLCSYHAPTSPSSTESFCLEIVQCGMIKREAQYHISVSQIPDSPLPKRDMLHSRIWHVHLFVLTHHFPTMSFFQHHTRYHSVEQFSLSSCRSREDHHLFSSHHRLRIVAAMDISGILKWLPVQQPSLSSSRTTEDHHPIAVSRIPCRRSHVCMHHESRSRYFPRPTPRTTNTLHLSSFSFPPSQ